MKYQAPLAALALATSALSAQAAAPHAEASARMSNLSIFAVDLVPSDGLAPSFTALSNPRSITSVFVNGLTGIQSSFSEQRHGTLAPLSLDQTAPGVSTHEEISPTGFDFSISIDGGHNPVTIAAYSYSDYNFPTDADFRLAPGSALFVTGTLDLVAKANCDASCYANASAYLFLAPAVQYSDGESNSKQIRTPGNNGGIASSSTPFGVTYANYSNEYLDLRLNFSVGMEASSTVPEPANVALLMAGLATVAAVRRKRK